MRKRDRNLEQYNGWIQIKHKVYFLLVGVVNKTPLYFPVSATGIGTYVDVGGHGLKRDDIVGSWPYSVRRKVQQKSAVLVKDGYENAWRKSCSFSGVNTCYFSGWISQNALRLDWCIFYFIIFSWCRYLLLDFWTAPRKVFYYAQNIFPLSCKRYGTASHVNQLLDERTHN